MGPITDYRQLLEVVNYNQEEPEQWYILLIFNPINRTPAIDTFLKNYQYLNDRTGNIHYFIPGLMNEANLKGDIFGPDWVRFQLSDCNSHQMLFDRHGLLKTVDWLEENCPSYSYREGIDLILMKSYGHKGNAKLDVKNLIYIPLEEIYREGGNMVDAITYIRMIARQNISFDDARLRILSDFRGNMHSRLPKVVKVFVAGSKELFHERNVVRSQLQQISNLTGIMFSSYTYEDFSRSFVEGGQQAEYNKFISTVADYAVFIIDGKIGGITFEEFNVAMQAFKSKGVPRIFTYCKDVDGTNAEIKHIIQEINCHRQYYVDYHDVKELGLIIHQDFMQRAFMMEKATHE